MEALTTLLFGIENNALLKHNHTMRLNHRKDIRFEDFGRVECSEVSPMAGILNDISYTGCKVHYDVPVALNMENDYEISIKLPRITGGTFQLIVHPRWINTQEDGSCDIGFNFLPSPDRAKLESYVNNLIKDRDSDNLELLIG